MYFLKEPFGLIVTACSGVEVRCLGIEFTCAGIDHLERTRRIQKTFFPEQLVCLFHVRDVLKLPQKPFVYHSDRVDFFNGHAAALQCLVHRKDSPVSAFTHAPDYFLVVLCHECRKVQVFYSKLRTPHCLEHCFLKILPDRHDFTGGFHLRAEFS